MEDCPPGGCISELATQMAIILAGKQFLFTFSQFVIPIMFSNRGSCWNRFELLQKLILISLNLNFSSYGFLFNFCKESLF